MQLGPRLEMEVVKAEEGLCSGQVLFHAHVQKPPEAAAAQHAAVQDREQLRTKRRQQQVGFVDVSAIAVLPVLAQPLLPDNQACGQPPSGICPLA